MGPAGEPGAPGSDAEAQAAAERKRAKKAARKQALGPPISLAGTEQSAPPNQEPAATSMPEQARQHPTAAAAAVPAEPSAQADQAAASTAAPAAAQLAPDAAAKKSKKKQHRPRPGEADLLAAAGCNLASCPPQGAVQELLQIPPAEPGTAAADSAAATPLPGSDPKQRKKRKKSRKASSHVVAKQAQPAQESPSRIQGQNLAGQQQHSAAVCKGAHCRTLH